MVSSYELWVFSLKARSSVLIANALGIGAASFAERSGAKIERKARRAAERPKKKSTDNRQQTTDFGPISLKNSEIQNFRISEFVESVNLL